MELTGTVVAGLQQARTLGYPTANLSYALDPGTVIVHGVYAGSVVLDGKSHPAALVVGGDFLEVTPPKCEAYVLDWSGDLYGKKVTFVFGAYIRALQRFDSVDALKEQIERDVAIVRTGVY